LRKLRARTPTTAEGTGLMRLLPGHRHFDGAGPRTNRSCPPRRRLARRVHLGCAGPTSRGAATSHSGDFRHLGGRDERRSAGGRMGRRGSFGRTCSARKILAARVAIRGVQPTSAYSLRPSRGPLDARYIPCISRNRPHVAGAFALRSQPAGAKSTARHPRRQHRF
jgi:hypothetical protein